MKADRYLVTVVTCAALISFPATAHASWLSEITGVNVDLNRGTVSVRAPNLQAIAPMIQNLPKDVGQAMLNPAAPALAAAIRFSKGQAQNSGLSPIPDDVKTQLLPYFPAQILDSVRWTTASPGRIGLDTILGGWFQQEGAITLDNVVVFSQTSLASDAALWAHELTHVMQYSNMGVETFAFQYSYDWSGLEKQARDNASMIVASINQGGPSRSGYSLNLASQAFQQPSSWATINKLAVANYDPVKCIWIAAPMTGNACPIVVAVTSVIVADQFGRTAAIPCNETTCVFGPNQQGPLISPPGYQVVAVTAAYQLP